MFLKRLRIFRRQRCFIKGHNTKLPHDTRYRVNDLGDSRNPAVPDEGPFQSSIEAVEVERSVKHAGPDKQLVKGLFVGAVFPGLFL